MQSKRWQDRYISFGQLARFSIIVTLFIFISAIWMLSIKGIVSTSWSIVLTVISGSITVYEFLTHRLLGVSQTPEATPAQTSSLPHLSTDDDAYTTFVEGERKRIYDAPNPHGTGELVIRADKSLVNEAVIVDNKSVIISEYTEKGQKLYVGIIRNLPEGNHYATAPQRLPKGFTIHTRAVSEIDLRNEN